MIGTQCASAAVEVPCTCGELVQGVLNGEPFLVSCPIDLYTRVTVVLDGELSAPAAASKARRAAEATLSLLGQGGRPFDLKLSCPLPPSKGFGTSTADVVATIVATSAAAGARLAPEEIARLAVSIEPSDGTMFPGLACFDHRSGGQSVALGGAPPLLVVVLEFGGSVDTLEYNACLDLAYLRSRERDYVHALDLLREGLHSGRLDMIGQAATKSARINQRLLPKPELGRAIRLGQEHGALGVCAAHSGTVLGVLFRPEDTRQAQAVMASAGDRLRGLERCWLMRMVDGGARNLAIDVPWESQLVAVRDGISTTETQRTRRIP